MRIFCRFLYVFCACTYRHKMSVTFTRRYLLRCCCIGSGLDWLLCYVGVRRVALAVTYRYPIFQGVWCALYKFSMLQHANRFVQQSQPVTFINDIRQDAGSRSLSVQMFQALDIVCHTLALCPLFDTYLVISCMRLPTHLVGWCFVAP